MYKQLVCIQLIINILENVYLCTKTGDVLAYILLASYLSILYDTKQYATVIIIFSDIW